MAACFKRPERTVVGVVGLGYVGLPLLVELAKKHDVIGYDVNGQRVQDLKSGIDKNKELSEEDVKNCSAVFTNDEKELKACNFYIVSVPTPIDSEKKPDLTLLEKASETVSRYLKNGDVVVLESTVSPGVTEDVCGAILEKNTQMVSNRDFFLGYSPERVNPGDQVNSIRKITKVVSAQNEEVLDYVADIYGVINDGNIFRAKSIKVAEAAKVIENAQRDINIAFINEITKILNQIDIQVFDVLEAAKTKWNFLDFKPGLVGGHCIGVDPYYLSCFSEKLGIKPDVITAGRAINDHMSEYIAEYIKKKVGQDSVARKKLLLLGFSFKENVNDIRNTKIFDLYKALIKIGYDVDIYDPLVDPDEVRAYYGITIQNTMPETSYDVLSLCVPHHVFLEDLPSSLSSLKEGGLIFDLKAAWKKDIEPHLARYKYYTL